MIHENKLFDIEKFLSDEEENEAFIIGGAGTGKTTILDKVTKELLTKGINFLVCAYTHKAKDILRKKLVSVNDESIVTLHSFLKKRPHINSEATTKDNVLITITSGEPKPLNLLIVDECSFIGTRDYASITDLYNISNIKVIFVGDFNQLEPVGDTRGIYPRGSYYTKLTKVYRQTEESDLYIYLNYLKETIEWAETNILSEYPLLKPTKSLKIVDDIVGAYMKDTLPSSSKMLLAYTNKKVQHYNAEVEGITTPIVGSVVNIPSLKLYNVTITNIITEDTPKELLFGLVPTITLTTPRGEIDEYTKYNPLKTILAIKEVVLYEIDNSILVPAIFGSYTNKVYRDTLNTNLVTLNSSNSSKSKQAYKLLKTVSDFVSVMEFAHCITVHKAQGSECANVYIDYEDMRLNRDLLATTKLLYTAISRATSKAIIKQGELL